MIPTPTGSQQMHLVVGEADNTNPLPHVHHMCLFEYISGRIYSCAPEAVAVTNRQQMFSFEDCQYICDITTEYPAVCDEYCQGNQLQITLGEETIEQVQHDRTLSTCVWVQSIFVGEYIPYPTPSQSTKTIY